MSTNNKENPREKDKEFECGFNVGDEVIVIFRKYGIHKFIGIITEICTNMHDLEGVWISAKPVKEYESDEIAKKMILNKVGVMVPLEDVRELSI